MILSRHFYALDEVQAALHDCITRNNIQETVFWCYELIQSGCASEAISTLFDAWIWQKGAFQLSWLLHAWSTLSSSELTENDILVSAYQHSWIPYHKRDNSVFSLLALGSVTPERVTFCTPSHLPPYPISDLELYHIRAIYQGKGHCAWWSGRQLSDERLWQLLTWYVQTYGDAERDALCFQALQNYDQLLGYKSDEYDMVMKCMAVCIACLSNEQRQASYSPIPTALPAELSAKIDTWYSQTGRISQRLFTIPSSCLYGRTYRGHRKWAESTVPFLNAMDDYLIGCPFWEDALTEYASWNESNQLQWKSEDAQEAFYQRYLPDDHPDEWTKENKLRSHGDGMMSPRDSPTLVKFVRLYLSKRSRLAWNTSKKIQSLLEGQPGDCPNDLLQWLLQTNQTEPVIHEHQFDPVHRKYIL